jgi:2-C-methyl-D-erythritol 4-phosphate cytidylyltransferase
MGAEVPKQYLPLCDATVIEASISCFLRHPKISGVVVALHAEDQYWNSLAVVRHEKIHTVIGGKTRTDSVYNALKYLDNTPAEEQDFVLVHDAARPCLRDEDVNLLMQKLEQDDVGGILAAPASDTLKLAEQPSGSNSDSNATVSKTLDRSMIWKAFTPQMFRLGVLKKALSHCGQNNTAVTDEASAIEALGLKVQLVEGRSDNIKVTHAEDLVIAAAILNN